VNSKLIRVCFGNHLLVEFFDRRTLITGTCSFALSLVHGVFDLAYFIEVFLSQRLVFFVLEADVVLFLLEVVSDCELVVLLASSFDLGRDHQYVVESDDDWVVIIQLLCLLDLLGQQVGILFYHFVDHIFYHTKVHHDVVLGEAVRLLQLLELPAGIIVYQGEDLFNVYFDLIDFLNCCFVLHDVLLVFAFTLMDLLFQFLLLLLPLVIFSKSLIAVPFNLLFHLCNFLIQLLVLLSQFIHILAQSEVPFFSLNEIADKFIDVLRTSCLQDLLKGLLILFQFLLWDKARDLVFTEAKERLLALFVQIDFLFLFGLPV